MAGDGHVGGRVEDGDAGAAGAGSALGVAGQEHLPPGARVQVEVTEPAVGEDGGLAVPGEELGPRGLRVLPVEESDLPAREGPDVEGGAGDGGEPGHLAGTGDVDEVPAAPGEHAVLDRYRAGEFTVERRVRECPARGVDRQQARLHRADVVHAPVGGEGRRAGRRVARRVEVGEGRGEAELPHVPGLQVDDGGEGAALHQVRLVREGAGGVDDGGVGAVHDARVPDPGVRGHPRLGQCGQGLPGVRPRAVRDEQAQAARVGRRDDRPVRGRFPAAAELLARVRDPGPRSRAGLLLPGGGGGGGLGGSGCGARRGGGAALGEAPGEYGAHRARRHRGICSLSSSHELPSPVFALYAGAEKAQRNRTGRPGNRRESRDTSPPPRGPVLTLFSCTGKPCFGHIRAINPHAPARTSKMMCDAAKRPFPGKS
ncbi:conserved hypothetical protein [Streptomyces sp. SPB074]|nr:conserved hypothetical protein [Streptomyces sp. SPB074]